MKINQAVMEKKESGTLIIGNEVDSPKSQKLSEKSENELRNTAKKFGENKILQREEDSSVNMTFPEAAVEDNIKESYIFF